MGGAAKRAPRISAGHGVPHAMAAMRVRSTHQLSGQLDSLTAKASRICLDWDQVSGSLVTRATSNPAT